MAHTTHTPFGFLVEVRHEAPLLEHLRAPEEAARGLLGRERADLPLRELVLLDQARDGANAFFRDEIQIGAEIALPVKPLARQPAFPWREREADAKAVALVLMSRDAGSSIAPASSGVRATHGGFCLIPLKLLASVSTKNGVLELRQRGDDYLISIDGRVLMASSDRRSEEALATLACKQVAGLKAPRVLIGGLGLAYTLRAALDSLPQTAHVTVAELTAEVETWCRGPLAPLTEGAVLDPRVTVVIDDVGRVIERAPARSFDAIILDLYEGPHAKSGAEVEPFYGRRALARSHAALSPGGVLALWSEDVNRVYTRVMTAAGFVTTVHKPGGTRAYGVYLGVRS